MLDHPDYCESLGRDAQNFVKKNWSAKIVAKRYLALVKGEISEDVFRSPYDDCDIYGCGIKSSDRQDLIKGMIATYGQTSLCIDDKPQILQALQQEKF